MGVSFWLGPIQEYIYFKLVAMHVVIVIYSFLRTICIQKNRHFEMPQIVLMTGCSSGIGLATAKRLAHDPDQRFVIIATVIAMSEKDDLVAAVGEKLDKTVFIKKLDLTIDQDITDVVDDVIKTHVRVDVLRKNDFLYNLW